jgi:hypothetical protein
MLDEAHKQPTAYKLVVVGEEEKVVGLHIIGEGSDEIMQGCKYLINCTGGHADIQSLWPSRWELLRKTLMILLLSVSYFGHDIRSKLTSRPHLFRGTRYPQVIVGY